MVERRNYQKEDKVFRLAALIIVIIIMTTIMVIVYGIRFQEVGFITAGIFSLVSLAVAGLAMFLDKSVVLGFGAFKVKIGSRELEKEAMVLAKRGGKSPEEVQRIVLETKERYPDGATVVYKPDGSVRIEATGLEVGLIVLPDLAANMALQEIVEEPPIIQPTIYHKNDKVPESGIYLVVDKDGNWLGHENTYVEGKKFGPFNDERAAGYVFHRKTMFIKPHPIFLPTHPVETSGIYDVVNEDGAWIIHQEACRSGDVFPPVRHEGAYGYVLREAVINKPA